MSHAHTRLDDCRLVDLARFVSPEGSLTPVEGERDVPFPIERVYYLYDVPGGEARGGHAHRELRQLIVAASGAFDILIDDGHERRTIRLDRAFRGLLLPPMIWRELENFSSGAVCLVLASASYDEADYVREYDAFQQDKHAAPPGTAGA
ncbi:sugar 3,4-ketoisomerase [Roseisolibacter agri]|uniref:Sugar 3,4-ketoisomerase QdtA cupin domain-containing protein n=1 Tax=Roseisolibacter agri TaxID=2014610 RepID=A0AA37V456_9BACT|nr:FdtA/QdtA family cupin domain-containing protein [Roseisolibacter agri]GLC27492.1 hypothetical protein rosag_40050 [Roseisolibacter agri]